MSRLCKTSVMAVAILTLTAGLFGLAPSIHAQDATATVQISVKNHRFQPAEIRAAANKPIILRIKNLDGTPMEFESVTLRVEKVVAGNSEGIIRLRALTPGRYDFFDDFHPETRGTLLVQ